jgi:hypothetical protein
MQSRARVRVVHDPDGSIEYIVRDRETLSWIELPASFDELTDDEMGAMLEQLAVRYHIYTDSAGCRLEPK